MTVYKINENCSGDCKVSQNGEIEVLTTECNKKEKLRLGDVEIPCENVAEEWLTENMKLKPGERIKLNKNTFIDYEGGKRIHLSYEKYMILMEMVRLFGSVKLYEQKCRLSEYGMLIFGSWYTFNEREIWFFSDTGKCILFTEDGNIEVDIQKGCSIYKGECRVCFPDGTSICYGNPDQGENGSI